MNSVRFRSSASYGLMGEFDPLREELKRAFAEDDRLCKEFERWEFERKQRSREKDSDAPVVKPVVETVSENDRRIVKRSHSDSIERVWIAGYSRSKFMIHGIANTPTINSNNEAILTRGCEINVPVPLMFRHKDHSQIGEVVFMEKSEGKIYIRAALFTHEAGQYAWRKIVLGEFSGLSAGCVEGEGHLQAEVNGVKFWDKWRIKEVSICLNGGANPDCHFEIYSPFKGRE
jgi:hypothetical protein